MQSHSHELAHPTLKHRHVVYGTPKTLHGVLPHLFLIHNLAHS